MRGKGGEISGCAVKPRFVFAYQDKACVCPNCHIRRGVVIPPGVVPLISRQIHALPEVVFPLIRSFEPQDLLLLLSSSEMHSNINTLNINLHYRQFY